MPPSPTDPRPNPLGGPGDYTTTKVVHSDTYAAISPLSANLSGKSIFIVGASKGIGKAIALSYARAGASRIAIAARSDLSNLISELRTAASEAKRPDPEIVAVKVDITERVSVEAGAKEVADKFGGKLDFVIHNSGILDFGTVVDGDPDRWWRIWEVNIKGLHLVARSFVPLLLAGGQDQTFVAISSVGAHLRGPGLSAYQTSKLAVLRLMEFLDAEYGEKGLLAYAVHPGNVPGTDILGGGSPAEELKFVFTETTEICGDSLVYLTKEKRDWLAGRYINCTWDMPELMMKKEEIVKGDKLKVRLVL